MSTTQTTPDMTSALQSVEAALSTGLKSLGSTSSVAETPSAPAPATPAPPPAAPAPESASPTSTPTPAPAAAAPAPAPGTPPSQSPPPAPASPVDLSSLSPAARRYLEMNGGDPDRALAKAIQDNNRLASFYRAHPELFAPGGPLDPKAPPQIPPDQAVLFTDPRIAPGTSPTTSPIPPAGTAAASPGTPIPGISPETVTTETTTPTPPPVEIDWAEVRTATDSYVQQDETCKNLVGAWTRNHMTVQQEQTNISELSQSVAYLESVIKDERLGLSEVDKQDRIAELREKRSDLALLRQDVMLRSQEMRAQDVEFRGIRKQIYDSIASNRQQVLQQQAQEAESGAYQAQAFQELSTQWEPALYRAAQSASIPPTMFERFKEVAKREAQARHAADETYYIDNIDVFVSEVARQFVGDMDAYHRAQSATYATLAAQRASAPSPILPPGTPAPAPAPVRDLSPEEITDRLSSELRSGLRRSRV